MRLLILSLALLATAALADEPDTIIFSHGLHGGAEIECSTCHEGLVESVEPGDTFYPDMDVCGDCHDVDDDENCEMCHTNLDNAGEYQRRAQGSAIFVHGPHLKRKPGCTVCHGQPDLEKPAFPGKPECRKCHETAENYSDCSLCHVPEFNLKPPSHEPTWINFHGSHARDNQAACALCHTETTCQECHAGDNVRPRSHDLNYAYNHSLDARGNSLECATCHQDPEYCSGCHAAEHILPSDHSQAGWLNPSGGGRHATEGLFDMESCIACHSAGPNEPTCAQCHGR